MGLELKLSEGFTCSARSSVHVCTACMYTYCRTYDTYIFTHIHTGIHPSIHPSPHTCTHMYIHMYTYVYIYIEREVCIHTYVYT